MPGRRARGTMWLSFRGEVFELDSAGDYQPIRWPDGSARPATLLGSHPMHARPIAELIRFDPRKHLQQRDIGRPFPELFAGAAA